MSYRSSSNIVDSRKSLMDWTLNWLVLEVLVFEQHHQILDVEQVWALPEEQVDYCLSGQLQAGCGVLTF